MHEDDELRTPNVGEENGSPSTVSWVEIVSLIFVFVVGVLSVTTYDQEAIGGFLIGVSVALSIPVFMGVK